MTEDKRFESMMRQKLELTSNRSKLRIASDVIISDPNFPFIGYYIIYYTFHFQPFDKSKNMWVFFHFSLQHMLEILPDENDKPAIFLCSLPFCEVPIIAY